MVSKTFEFLVFLSVFYINSFEFEFRLVLQRSSLYLA
jgi:hypothetical protein